MSHTLLRAATRAGTCTSDSCSARHITIVIDDFSKNGEIGLRLGAIAEPYRILHRDHRARAERGGQAPRQRDDEIHVRVTDRCHLDDLSVYQLDPVALGQDAGFAHAVVLVDIESAARQVRIDDESGIHRARAPRRARFMLSAGAPQARSHREPGGA